MALSDGNGQLATGTETLAAGASTVSPTTLLHWLLVLFGVAAAAVAAWIVHRVRFRSAENATA